MADLQLSRRRLLALAPITSWPDLLGPYIIGVCAAQNLSRDQLGPVILLGLYFSLPSASLLGGLARAFDEGRTRLSPTALKWFAETMVWLHLPIILLVPFLPYVALLGLVGFWVLGIFNLVPPVRANRRWLLDLIFAAYPAFAALAGYGLVSLVVPAPNVMFAAGLWYGARYLTSVVNADIENLTVDWLGQRASLILASAMWLAGGLLIRSYIGWISIGVGIVFGVATLINLREEAPHDSFRLEAMGHYLEWVTYGLLAVGVALR